MKKALLVIDMQNDYLWSKRKKKFAYRTDTLIGSINSIIQKYRQTDCAIIYIKHIIQNLPTNRLLFGYSIAGTKGAELYDGLDIVSDNIFEKLIKDALSNKSLREFLADNNIDTLHLCGIDECGCVASTALGARKRGFNVSIIKSGTATVLSKRQIEKTHKKLKNAGVDYI